MTTSGQGLRRSLSACLPIPIFLLWLATTWTEIDLVLVLAAFALAFLTWSTGHLGCSSADPRLPKWFLAAGAVTIGFDLIIGRLQVVDQVAARSVQVAGLIVIAWVWFCLRRSAHKSAVLLILAHSLVLGAIFIAAVEEPGIDVWRAHTGGAQLLSEGLNPYTDLNLSLEPGQIGGPLRQYFYPPLALIWYTIWTLVLGDPRWASLVAWLLILGLGSILALRQSKKELGISVITFAAVQPGWFLLLAGSFTEPLVVLLVVASMWLATKKPILSAALLGFALASKQHMLLVLPLIAWSLWRNRPARAWVLVVSASVAFLTGLVFGPVAYLNAVLIGPTLAPPNQSGVNLYAVMERLGLHISAPLWLPVVAALGVTLLLRKSPRRQGWPADILAAVMAVFLSLVPFVIWSHWMIVTLLLTVYLFTSTLRRAVPLAT